MTIIDEDYAKVHRMQSLRYFKPALANWKCLTKKFVSDMSRSVIPGAEENLQIECT